MTKPPNIKVDAENLILLRDSFKIGTILELPKDDAGLVAKHISQSADTVYAACSGVPLVEDSAVFAKGQTLLAIEWVRHESHPASEEPECNVYRFLFGLSKDEKHCYGIDVTKSKAPGSGQVSDHWSEFDEVFARHFGNQ